MAQEMKAGVHAVGLLWQFLSYAFGLGFMLALALWT
jgi:hypothetical protein